MENFVFLRKKFNKYLHRRANQYSHREGAWQNPTGNTVRPKIFLRLFGVCFFGCLTGFLWFESPYWMAGIWTALVTVALFYDTVRFVDQSKAKLTAFLQSLQQNDFSVTFSENLKSDDFDLHHAFNQLNDTYKLLRSKKEEQHQLLQVVVEHAAVPLICFDDNNGKVHLTNEAAKRLLNTLFIQTIDSLSRVDRTLPHYLREIKDGESSSFKLVSHGKEVFMSVTSRHIIFKDTSLKMVAFHDVSRELAAKEADAWQKLLRVLTHEISNSAIPLSTLSSYIYDMVTAAESENRKLSAEERQDVLESLKTIGERSKSLSNFLKNFKSVNQIPEPNFQRVSINELVNESAVLFGTELKNESIKLLVEGVDRSKRLFIRADKNLTMQVIINLIKNAIEAMANFHDNKFIEITAASEGDKFVHLYIRDTGCGIPPNNMDQIFIPFYSTKKGGSGIGLSISKQIMQKQKGDISVQSVSGRGSVFTLTFICNG